MIIFDDITDMEGYPIKGTGEELTEEFNRLAKRGQPKRLTPKKFNWIMFWMIASIVGVVVYKLSKLF